MNQTLINMKKKSFYPKLINLLAAMIFCFVWQGCIPGLNCENGNGRIIKEDRSIGAFSEIEVSGAYNIILKQDSISSVSVETDSNLLKLVITRIEGNKLIIENDENICSTKETNVYISTANIIAISVFQEHLN